MTGVSAVMIVYNNEDRALTRWQRDLLPALRRLDEVQMIVIDNSERRCNRLARAVMGSGIEFDYHWPRQNLLYGPGLNLAVKVAAYPRLLYVCSEHGRAYDPTWPADLLAPLAHETVAMTGTLAASGPPEQMGFPAILPDVHVQGGVFGARTDVLRCYPYPDGEYAHWGADVFEGFTLWANGYRLVDVPTVRSVWRGRAGDGDWKYVHEDPDA